MTDEHPHGDNHALAAAAVRDLDLVRNAVAMMRLNPGVRMAIESDAAALELRIRHAVAPKRETPPRPPPMTPEEAAQCVAEAHARLAEAYAAAEAVTPENQADG